MCVGWDVDVALSASMSQPMVSVPLAKVVFNASEVQVRYVMVVKFQGREWKIERGYSEIAEFRKRVVKGVCPWAKGSRVLRLAAEWATKGTDEELPSFPPAAFKHWHTNKSWSLIEERRRLLQKFFAKLNKTEIYYMKNDLFDSFLDVDDHMRLPLTERAPPPMSLDTTWWCSNDDVGIYLRDATKKVSDIKQLPKTLVISTPSGSVKQDNKGIVITFNTPKGTPRMEQRAHLQEVSALYGWIASHGDTLPSSDSVMSFIRLLVRHRRTPTTPLWSSSHTVSTLSSTASLTSSSSSIHDSPPIEITVTPPPSW
eukprot:TRINITY_DN11797_c0_g1_i1.p1 TRINITY_DN11797_c0_g1~~TRINITY_DN11797_c0_g1_i1.p1  ORF type:complete len:327 (+),score=73.66 TRINITY_DN11797_c0_g1_i1:44-982(+)